MHRANRYSPKNHLKKTKSLSTFSATKRIQAMSEVNETIQVPHELIPTSNSIVLQNKISTIPRNLTEYFNKRTLLKEISPGKNIKYKNTFPNSYLEKTRKNSVLTSYKERTNKLEQKIQSTRKISLNLANNQLILKNIKYSQPKKQEFMNPEIQTIKNYSQTISTNSSGKKINTTLGLDDFVVGMKIGTGKYGQVFMARHRQSGTVFALKKISKANINEEIKNQLIYEIKIQSYLDHPNVVKLYAFFSDSENIYLVMELCTTGHLFDLLKVAKALPEKSTKIVVKQLCQGLDYLHHNKIIHRDLKLQNILYHFGMIKICDFGWSTICATLRQTFCGTPLYISPELLQRKNYNSKVDIWSIGVLAYELMFGKVPFEIKNQSDFVKIVDDELEFPDFPDVSITGKEFLLGCLDKNPEQRLEITELIEHPFLSNCESVSSSELY